MTEDSASGGQIWTRLYARRSGFPQVVHSSKRFAGPTGLEEYVGYGVGMTLTVDARDGALVFRSEDYFLELFGRRLRLPAWLYARRARPSPMPSCRTASSASRCRSSIRGSACSSARWPCSGRSMP